MAIHPTNANIIVLYGDEAAQHYVELVQHWGKMISANDWASLYFLIVANQQPDYTVLTAEEFAVVGRITTFRNINEEPLTTDQYAQIAWNLPQAGTPNLHLICASGNENCSYAWLEQFVQNVLRDNMHFTQFLLYYMLRLQSLPAEREGMQNVSRILREQGNGHHCNTFLIGDTDDGGTRVDEASCWNALYLSSVLNCAQRLPLTTNTYSLGYSVLNANGKELENIRLNAACSVLLERLAAGSFSQADALSVILPTGVTRVDGLRDWLTKYVNDHVQLAREDFYNAWITIRMNHDMDGAEACRRLKCFVDMNYCQTNTITQHAEELAQQLKSDVINKLRRMPETVIFPMQTVDEVINAFERISNEDTQIPKCEFGRKPFLKRNWQEYTDKNKVEAYTAVSKYAKMQSLKGYAGALAEAYRFIENWIKNVGEDEKLERGVLSYLQRRAQKLCQADGGNVPKLQRKYPRYTQAIQGLHPSMSTMTANIQDVLYFDDVGAYVKPSMEKLIDSAQSLLKSQLPGLLSRRFFDVLQTEFDGAKLKDFFDDYLRPGQRMYYNLAAPAGVTQSFYIVDENLADQWDNPPQNLSIVQTDNAENLTLYPTDGAVVEELLSNTAAYFHGVGNGALRPVGDLETIHRGNSAESAGLNPINANAALPNHQTEAAPAENTHGLTLQPAANQHYLLSWDWDGNEQLATVRISQFGEPVGDSAVVSVAEFINNNHTLDVTQKVMHGRPIPYGELTVMISSGRNIYNIYINASVPGRHEQVNYSITGNTLELTRISSSNLLERIALRITNRDGQWLYFPLYASSEEHPYKFENLRHLENAMVVEAPLEKQAGNIPPVFAQRV